MDKTKTNVLFSFCLKPVSRENIVRINIVIQDSILIKEALSKAISVFNDENSFFKIKDDVSLYQLKMMKKNGLPDYDLPGTQSSYNRNRY